MYIKCKLRECLTVVPLLILFAAAASAAELTGSLTDATTFQGYSYRVYVFSPSAETGFSVVMRSDEFDPYLMVVRPDGTVLINDDHAIEGIDQTGLDAGIAVNHPIEGTWTLIATTFVSETVGDYALVSNGLRELHAADHSDRKLSISKAFSERSSVAMIDSGSFIDSGDHVVVVGDDDDPEVDVGATAGDSADAASDVDVGATAGESADAASEVDVGATAGDSADAAPVDDAENAWLPALLPWPPPSPSSQLVINRDFLREAGGLPATLAQVDTKLQEALSGAGYWGSTYWGVPGGFAVVAPLEQTDAGGAPLHGQARWTAAIFEMKSFSLAEYLKALFTAPPGYFRVLVFVVSPQAFAPSDSEATLATIARWSRGGLSFLPDQIGQEEFTGRHRITVLVYEFMKKQNADQPVTSVPGRLTARAHLAATNLTMLWNR